MFNSLTKMIFAKQSNERCCDAPEAHDPHRRGVITAPGATRRDSATYEPIIRNFW